MPNDCPECCRALAEIERMVVDIKEMTEIFLSRSERFMTQGTLGEREKLVSEHRTGVETLVNKITRSSREARDAACQ